MPTDPRPQDPSAPAYPDVPDVVHDAADAGTGTAPEGDETPEGDELPDEDELARIARPATVRRAPKFSAFLVVGGLVGLLLGLLLVAVVNPQDPVAAGQEGIIPFVDRQGMLRLTMAGGGLLVGVLVGGALAILADRRSVRRARGPVRP